MSEQPTTPQLSIPTQRADASVRAKAVLRYARDIILSLSVSAFIIIFAYQPVKVEGTSMMPSLADQERIFINKYVYRWEAIDRGDVVVFRYPYDHSKSYIKRVVGVPGDTVEIVEGQVFVNGQKLIEPYVPGNFRDDRSYSARVIPADSYFVLGDHRNLSSDSRDFGPVSRDLIFGKAVFAYWPASKVGKLD